MLKTHACALLNKKNIGESVTLAGWVHARRDHGGLLFIDLRDRSGIIQVVFKNPDLRAQAQELSLESVVQVQGRVMARSPETVNPEIETGAIEIEAQALTLLAKAKALPFMVNTKSVEASEEVRLKYRYLDLRRPKMQKALSKRHEFSLALRNFLTKEGFWEIETPILTKSTPEGARDFLVPARLAPGNFYALPQSPQIFKQMLMVSGVEKYFQIARCFRDEDLRADRQLEHTQLDMEMSFVETQDIWDLAERVLTATLKETFGLDLKTPFEKLSYQEAMSRYQTDKPDLRYRDFTRAKLNDTFKNTSFKVFESALAGEKSIHGLKIPRSGIRASRGELDKSVALAKSLGAQGLVWIKILNGNFESPIEKHLNDKEKESLRSLANDGDIVFLVAEEANMANRVLSELQKKWAQILNYQPQEALSWVWIYDFPLLEYSLEEKRWQATHNPFTAPKEEDLNLLGVSPEKIRSRQYDLVLNGVELGSGGIRNHKKDQQSDLFAFMGYTKKEIEERFGWMLDAFDYGAPPHGGFALGLDRLLAILLGEDSIREVIAFPKTQKGVCPFSGAPTPAEAIQLKELGIKLLEEKR